MVLISCKGRDAPSWHQRPTFASLHIALLGWTGGVVVQNSKTVTRIRKHLCCSFSLCLRTVTSLQPTSMYVVRLFLAAIYRHLLVIKAEFVAVSSALMLHRQFIAAELLIQNMSNKNQMALAALGLLVVEVTFVGLVLHWFTWRVFLKMFTCCFKCQWLRIFDVFWWFYTFKFHLW